MEKIKQIWNFTVIPAFLAVYYIAKYGLKNAGREAEKELERVKNELKQH